MFGLIVDPRKIFVHNAVREVSDIAYFDETKVLFFSEAPFFNKTFFQAITKRHGEKSFMLLEKGSNPFFLLSFQESAPAQQGTSPNFVWIQKKAQIVAFTCTGL